MNYLSLAPVVALFILFLSPLRAEWFLVDGKLVYVQPLSTPVQPWPEPAYKSFLREKPEPVVVQPAPTPTPKAELKFPSLIEGSASRLKKANEEADARAAERRKQFEKMMRTFQPAKE